MTTYFFDSYLPRRLAHMLRELDVPIVHQLELPQPRTAEESTVDSTWVQIVREDDYTLITVDRVSRKDTAIPLALELRDIAIVFLPASFSSLDKWTQASWLIKNWPTIDTYCLQAKMKTWARVSLSGDIAPIDNES